ncbi:hypothetical protein [Corynebacterium frankenforstense]|uniref:hypothetical protein n=1 Tax=Corynebacterium frankenforstense TaxID=1230998 RepID=UPI0026F15EAF|nr:hypothetical protein [Corynebacterium frankenforstense]
MTTGDDRRGAPGTPGTGSGAPQAPADAPAAVDNGSGAPGAPGTAGSTGVAGTSGKGSKSRKEDAKRPPEAVRILVALWRGIVGLEILHQLLSVAGVLADPGALRTMARETLESTEGADVSPQMLDVAVYASAGFSALVGIAIQLILLWATVMIARRHRWSDGSRRLLMFFSIYLVIRAVALFGVGAAGAGSIPVALLAVDGSVQVLAGVAAALALVYIFNSETVRWTAEAAAEQDRTWTDPGNR